MSPGDTAAAARGLGCAAALSSCSECIIAGGHLSGNSQDTRHELALSQLVSEVVGGCC